MNDWFGYKNPNSILKWAGSKRRLLPQIARYLPPRIENWLEPFMGGGSVILGLRDRVTNAYCYDGNNELVQLHKALRDSPQAVFDQVQMLRTDLMSGELDYQQLIDLPTKSNWEAAARLICINRMTFNGIYRQRKDGRFSNPQANGPEAIPLDRSHMFAISETLKGVQIGNGDYRNSLAFALETPGKEWTVYADPPYHGSTFTYTRPEFTDEDQAELARRLSWLMNAGATVVASNADTPFIREYYNGWNFEVVEAAQNMAAHSEKRVPRRELIIHTKGILS